MVAERHYTGVPAEELRRVFEGYLAGTYHPRDAQPDRETLIAEVEGSFAGYIAGHRSNRFGCEGELQWLNVKEEFRGTGVADRLMLALAAWFRSRGIAKVCVNVAEDNARARAFYHRHGAIRLSDHWMGWDCIGEIDSA